MDGHSEEERDVPGFQEADQEAVSAEGSHEPKSPGGEHRPQEVRQGGNGQESSGGETPETSVDLCAAADCNNHATHGVFCEYHWAIISDVSPGFHKVRLDPKRFAPPSYQITRPCAIKGCKEKAEWQVTHHADPLGIRVCQNHMQRYQDHPGYSVTLMPQDIRELEGQGELPPPAHIPADAIARLIDVRNQLKQLGHGADRHAAAVTAAIAVLRTVYDDSGQRRQAAVG